MSNLYEKYQRLVKAGMPEIETLLYSHGEWQHRVRRVVPGLDIVDGKYEQSDAHDLITAHAMRWWLKSVSWGEIYVFDTGCIARWCGGQNTGNPVTGAVTTSTILDAILAAVEKEGDK